jgi:hypothetical protein
MSQGLGGSSVLLMLSPPRHNWLIEPDALRRCTRAGAGYPSMSMVGNI